MSENQAESHRKKKIAFYNHPDDPGKNQIFLAKVWPGKEILEWHLESQANHRKMFGETEKEELIKGKKIVFWTKQQ